MPELAVGFLLGVNGTWALGKGLLCCVDGCGAEAESLDATVVLYGRDVGLVFR